jgi:predicted DNA-binding antitoxin AbrB/MazE fold protein
MGKSLIAVYEDGVFKPLEPVKLKEHQQVVVAIPDTEEMPPDTAASPAQGVHARPQTGAELVAYWQQEGVSGSRPEITDSVAYAQALRREAETR